jgi:hypothetical protein
VQDEREGSGQPTAKGASMSVFCFQPNRHQPPPTKKATGEPVGFLLSA